MHDLASHRDEGLELQEILTQGEGQHLEYKRSLGQLSRAIETLCAFADQGYGGKVLIGVEDPGEAVGVQLGRDTLEKTAHTFQTHTLSMTAGHPLAPLIKVVQFIADSLRCTRCISTRRAPLIPFPSAFVLNAGMRI